MTVSLASGCPHARVTLESSSAHTTSSNTGSFQTSTYGTAQIYLDCTAASGTSPTLDVYVQGLLPDGATWQDVAHFSQATGVTSQIVSLVSEAPQFFSESEAALAAGSTLSQILPPIMRIKWVIAGTSASFTFALTGDFYARS